MAIFEPEGEEDPEDDYEIVFPISKSDIDKDYQLSLIKKLTKDNGLDNFQNLLKACLAVDLAPTDIFQFYYTDTNVNEFFEGFDEKIDIDDVLPILNSIVEKIHKDLQNLENNVQSLPKEIIQKFDDQRQLEVMYDAIKDYNEEGGQLQNFDVEKIKSNILIWKIKHNMEELTQILTMWDTEYFGKETKTSMIEEFNKVIEDSDNNQLTEETKLFLTNLKIFDDLGHLLKIKDFYLQLLKMSSREEDYFETMQSEHEKMKKYGILNDEIDSLKKLVEFFDMMDSQKGSLKDMRNIARLVDENITLFQGYYFSLKGKITQFRQFSQEISEI